MEMWKDMEIIGCELGVRHISDVKNNDRKGPERRLENLHNLFLKVNLLVLKYLTVNYRIILVLFFIDVFHLPF